MKILSAIVCEDIRQEKNNKHFLIGVFGPDISVSAMPGSLVLCYFLQVMLDKERRIPHVEIEVSQEFQDGTTKLLAKGSVDLESRGSAYMMIATPQFTIELEQPCEIRFRLREEGKRWKTALLNSVKVDPNLSGPMTVRTP